MLSILEYLAQLKEEESFDSMTYTKELMAETSDEKVWLESSGDAAKEDYFYRRLFNAEYFRDLKSLILTYN